jgi:hypothetical protein
VSVNVIATIRKEAKADPNTGNYSFYPSLALFAEDGSEYETPIYFSGFDELAQVLQREAGVTRESLEDRFIRYDSGEEVQIHMSLEDDQIAYFGFSPHRKAA